jgi:hypothetical protein
MDHESIQLFDTKDPNFAGNVGLNMLEAKSIDE